MLAQDAAKLTSPHVYGNPNEVNALLKRIRREEPVIWVEPEDARPHWLITRAEDLRFIESHPEDFIAKPRSTVITLDEERRNLELYGVTSGTPLETLVNTDGLRHRQLRMISQGLFMPNAIKQRQPEIELMARQFVDKMAALQPECDFAADVAFGYPLRVINSILGLPEEFDALFLELTQQLFAQTDDDVGDANVDVEDRRAETLQKFFEIFAPIIEDRRKNPRDDVTSVLVNATIDGKPLNEMETLGYLVIAATAGHDTTSSTTAGGLYALMQNPEQLQALKEDLDLLPNAIEEFLRWVAPVKHFVRTAVRDIEVGGKEIKEGQSLAILFASTCRDESVFEAADEFNIRRNPNNHLAFGTGPHLCLGMHLARLEISAFYRELLPRLEKIELNGEPSYMKANVVSGLKSLPIKFKMN